MLDVAHQSYIDSIDEDDGCHPFFHHGHIGTIMLATQRINELLSSEASRIIEWNNRMEELKSKEGVNHG